MSIRPPPASGSTILAIAALVYLVVSLGLSVLFRHWGYSTEAGIMCAAGWAAFQREINEAVPVSDAPPNDPLPGATVPVGEVVAPGERHPG